MYPFQGMTKLSLKDAADIHRFFMASQMSSRITVKAEDGIRDAQESRGLGDVYKRQIRLLGSMLKPDFSGQRYSPSGISCP